MKAFPHIVSDAAILGGKPCVKGTRISVDLVLEWLASGASPEQIHEQYPQLTAEAIKQCIAYAAHYLKNEILIEVSKTA
jgi:uncharacterized protein (DUF433 family)